tara:strand:+ start:4358 stop:4750 length:393 start_codon:yes stop_codon:yes gene_type:complete
MPVFQQKVSFGDCDPAGIVFYPNIFRWMDAAFHHHLRQFGGHAHICKDLGALGIGAMNATSNFRSPLRDGDELDIHVSITGTQNKSIELTYIGRVGERLAFEGFETRAVFVNSERGISAANTEALLKILS